MNALKSLLFRVTEIQCPVAQLRISAPAILVYQLIDDYENSGGNPQFGSDVVSLGPLLIRVDDDLPNNTFMIKIDRSWTGTPQ
jgi:hypothetical protein